MPSCTPVLGKVVWVEADDREAREEAMPAQTDFTLSRSVLLPGLTVDRASRAAVTTTEADSHCWSGVRAEQLSWGKLEGRAGSSGLKPTIWKRSHEIGCCKEYR